MKDNRWQIAKEIFDEALGVAPELRARFVETSCSGDEQLRSEVEMLLGSYKSDFLEENALGAAELLIESNLTKGQVIGRYRIGALIGSGGMGEVYLADDTELDRPVAIKVLHRDVANDKERVRRFIQEARAASALNHPNILTIYEVGSLEGSRFIVSEYVNGVTLRERMSSGLTAAESLEITCQIAAALQAAHQAGIVHRDIKPENIMLRKDGLVKVLDFGLAKLTEADDLPIDPNASASSRIHTSPGLIMGTVAYMSPEQASGKTVDSRTDLWSLGVVFHEMLSGESPFKGESVTNLVPSILEHDPASLDLTKISHELQPMCMKALARDQEARYQTAQELLQDLQGEKKRMDYTNQSSAFITVSTTDELKTQLIRPRPTLSAEYIVTSVKRHKYATFVSLALVTFLAVGFSVYKYNGAPQLNGIHDAIVPAIGPSTTEADLKLSRFASTGKMAHVAISPDGRYIAYVTSDGPEKNSIRLRQRETSSDVELVQAPSEGTLVDLSFSPDSGQVYYRHRIPYISPAPNPSTINRVSVSGGASTKIVVDAAGGASVSPDGKTLTFRREVDTDGEGDDVLIANADGSNERVLVHSPASGNKYVRCGQVSAWSPDGRSIVCFTNFETKEEDYYRITYLVVSDGSMQLRNERWSQISGAVYMPDGSLVIAGKPVTSEALTPAQLWLIAPNTPPKSITSDITGYSGLTATRKGDVLITIQNRYLIDLWTLTGTDTSKVKPITTSGEMVSGGGFNWTPDGRILFCSKVSGNADIWIMNSDGSNRRQITADRGAKTNMSMSPDGRYIVFLLNAVDGVSTHVARMDADGKNLKQLTDSSVFELSPRISPDGKWVYYIQVPATNSEPERIAKVPIDGGEPVFLATLQGFTRFLDVSPRDGRIVFEDVLPAKDNKTTRVAVIISPESGQSKKTIELPPSARPDGPLRWTPDGRNIAFNETVINGLPRALGAIPVDRKGTAKQLLSFPAGVGLFEWSKDGKQLGFGFGSTTSDAVLITRKDN
ncbi:MAG: hypothetical protein DMF62_17395 [Acidobacteria bacterium]|nr:MAG: hypothetical protein DMF62_17395 [Acidobacteriota bacterium]